MKRFVISALIGMGALSLNATVIATVNGYPITLKEANQFVKKVTRGRATYSMLKKEDRRRVIQELATNKLLTRTAAKELKRSEKKVIWTDYYIRKHYKELMRKAEKELSVEDKYRADAELWVRKKSAKIPVTEEEMRAEYKKRKKLFKDPKTGKILPFEKVRPLIEFELKKIKFVKQMMEKAKIDYNPKPQKKKASKKGSQKKSSKKSDKKK